MNFSYKPRYVALALVAVVAAGVVAGAVQLLTPPAHPPILAGDGVVGPPGMVWVRGGTFLMGSNARPAQPNERPAHPVKVRGYWIDQHHVTNAEFREFVEITGYVTTAERKPDWETLRVQLPPGTRRPPDSALVPGGMVFVGTSGPVALDNFGL